MTATIFLLLFSLLLPATAGDLRTDDPRQSTDDPRQSTDDPQRRFREAGVTGCFLLTAIDGDSTLRIDAARCARSFTPASTFKILNSIIALEYGAVRDIDDTLRWDGRRHTIRSWNQDQCMRDAFQRSCVWFYQELARRIGVDRMREAIAAVGYGNQDISGGIDQFWLDGSMKISADGQADLLRRLWTDDLPFSAASQRTVKQLMLLEETGRYTLRGKTGTAIRDGSWLGWLVGYVEQGGRTYVYVLNVEEAGEGDLSTMRARRMELLRALLRDQGLL